MSDLAKDPFEEFEFRPINEGLGFHRKNNKSQTAQSTMTTGFEVGPSTSSRAIPSTNNFNYTAAGNSGFAAPLPRHNINPTPSAKSSFNIPTIEDDSIAKAQTAVNEILKNLNQKRQLDFANETERVNHELRKSRPMFFAAGLDGMLIIAGFLMSMIAMLSITKVDLFLNLSHPETSGLIYAATGLLFITVAFIYMVINRAFLGFTPGEWAFDQFCGQQRDKESILYVPRIAFRSLLVIGTGFITLQLLSYLFNKDIAGQISGVNLFRKANAQ